MYKGIPQNDIGTYSDVIDNISKEQGINMLIRSMSPQIIACDEIGSLDDVRAIQKAVCSGVKGIFTTHAASVEELKKNPNLKMIIESNLIKRIIILDNKNKGTVKEFFVVDSPK